MPINCPSALSSITITAKSGSSCSGSGTGGVCCIRGVLLGLIRSPAKASFDSSFDVYAKVYAGHLDDIPASYLTYAEAITGTLADTSGTSWCARCVHVPDLGADGASLPGSPLTVIVWQVVRATLSVEAISVHLFYGVNPDVGGTDCCVGCGSGSDSGSGNLMSKSGLADGSDLFLDISDGPNIGRYRAALVSRLRWRVSIGKDVVEIGLSKDSSSLVLSSGASTVDSTAVESSPFSATFPGKLLGSQDDVVITNV